MPTPVVVSMVVVLMVVVPMVMVWALASMQVQWELQFYSMSRKTILENLNRRGGIGRLVVILSFVGVIVTTIGTARFGWPSELQIIVQAGFIGGFTDTVAIHMIFTKVRFLPGSGVLINQRVALIRSLADTMERHILNPTLIEQKVREMSQNLDRPRLLQGANAVVDEIRPDMIAFINAPEQKSRISTAVRQEGGFWGDMADAVGVVTYDAIADRICAGLTTQMRHFQVEEAMLDRAMAYIGSIEEFLVEPDNPLVRKHYGSDQSIIQIAFERMDIKQLVIDRLNAYDANQIRDIISENIREHLAWLQVFGVLLGMVMASLILLLEALMSL
jgi:uncharacterized membrane protein YheB (UPF0754 family)